MLLFLKKTKFRHFSGAKKPPQRAVKKAACTVVLRVQAAFLVISNGPKKRRKHEGIESC